MNRGEVFNKVAVSIHAHPDDAEAWCAGTLWYLKEAGYRVYIATMTPGDMGGIGMSLAETAACRKKEAERAAKILNAEYHCFDQQDGYLFDSKELRIKVTSYLREVGAGVLFTHLFNDYHIDHRTTAQIVEAAAIVSTLPNVPVAEKPLSMTPILYHTTPMRMHDQVGGAVKDPDFFVNITSVIEKKMEMLSFHKTQIDLMRVMHGIDDFFGELNSFNRELGNLCNVPYAECFWLHRGGGFPLSDQIERDLSPYIIDRH